MFTRRCLILIHFTTLRLRLRARSRARRRERARRETAVVASLRPERLIPAQPPQLLPRARPKRPSTLRVHLSLLQRIASVHFVVTTRARAPQHAILHHRRVVPVVALGPLRARARRARLPLHRQLSIERIRAVRALPSFFIPTRALRASRAPVVASSSSVVRRRVNDVRDVAFARPRRRARTSHPAHSAATTHAMTTARARARERRRRRIARRAPRARVPSHVDV